MLKPLTIFMLALSVLAILAAPLARAGMDDDVRQLQREWEEVKYRKPKADQEKAFEALAQVGSDAASTVLPTLVHQTVRAQRSEEFSEWRHPHDLVALIRVLDRQTLDTTKEVA